MTEETNALEAAQKRFDAQAASSNKDVVAPKDAPNPANGDETFDESSWVSMSAPRARLAVQERPGWHRHWFRF